MLKKLRLKFIATTMAIVLIMLGIIFGTLYYSTKNGLERESMQMMGSVAMDPMRLRNPKAPREEVLMPYFCVLNSREGETMTVGAGFFDLSDEEYLENLLNAVRDYPDELGYLEDFGLRFLRRESPMGECIVFADLSGERATLDNLVKTLAMLGLIAIVCFLGISVLLARWAVKPVEKAWQQQKQFIADASHELKTPLTVIGTNAELINSPDCPEKDVKILSGNIISMTAQMRGLVEELLDLARVEGKSGGEEYRNIIVSDVVSSVCMQYEPLFFEKIMPFEYNIEENLKLSGSEKEINRLVGVYLENALKYASPGGETKLLLKSSGDRKCLLEVTNRGEELSAEELSNLYKRFYRGDKARTMNHSYGLGLSIAQSIAQAHRGRVWAESKNGYVSFFTELPRL